MDLTIVLGLFSKLINAFSYALWQREMRQDVYRRHSGWEPEERAKKHVTCLPIFWSLVWWEKNVQVCHEETEFTNNLHL